MSADLLDNPYAPPAAEEATAGQAGRKRRRQRSPYRDERRSVLLLIGFTVVTLGIYSAVWFIRRRHFLDSLEADVKLGRMAMAPLMATAASFVLAFVGLPPELDQALSVGAGVVSVLTAFHVARILRSDFARTGCSVRVSGVATFFFGALYLQYVINRAADAPRPKRGANPRA